jgi:hypothetical protein
VGQRLSGGIPYAPGSSQARIRISDLDSNKGNFGSSEISLCLPQNIRPLVIDFRHGTYPGRTGSSDCLTRAILVADLLPGAPDGGEIIKVS